MSTTNQFKLKPISDSWLVLQLRSTTFVQKRSLSETMEDNWWEMLTEDKPKEEHRDYANEVKQQIGTFAKYNLFIYSQTDRIDLILSGKPIPSSDAKSISSLSSTLEPFLDVVFLWLNICPLITRLAFGASLIMQVSDEDAGRKKLLEFLPDLHLNSSEISDLIYQINRPRDSESWPNVKINRLSQWSMPQANVIRTTEGALETQLSSEQKQYVCKLDFNINTAYTKDSIPKCNTCSLFQELVKLGREIAEDGDLP